MHQLGRVIVLRHHAQIQGNVLIVLEVLGQLETRGMDGFASVRPQFIEQLRVSAQQFEQENGGFMRLGFSAFVL